MHANKKHSILNNDLFISLIIAFSFLIVSIFLPIYDKINGLYNQIFDKYKIIGPDDSTLSNFYLTRNIIGKKSISFPKGYIIAQTKVENNVDFCEVNSSFYPRFNFFGSYIYAGILYIFSISTELGLFKGMILLNILFSAITLMVFYFIQKKLGLNTWYSFVSTLIAGIATSLLIYSKYLFISYTILNLFLMSLIYILLKYRRKMSLKIEIFATIIFSLSLIFLWYPYIVIIFLIVLSYFFIRYGFLSKKTLIISGLIVCIFIISFYSFYIGITPRIPPLGIKNLAKIGELPIITIFSNYVNALDYIVFGYHDPTSVWKLSRTYTYIYAFLQEPGNAVFLKFYGLFGSLFGPKGFVYNSPFLTFSILGIFLYKKGKIKNLLLVFIVLIILVYGFLSPIWYGGVIPRYVRQFQTPIFLLTFFSFYYIQETKNTWVKLIFLGLVILSVLNVASLAIRTDWNYEHEADLVSYDLILWPWYPIKGINFELSQTQWNENRLCPNFYDPNKITMDVCNCTESGFASKKLTINKKFKSLNIIECALFSGGDGVYSIVSIDSNIIFNGFTQWNNCENRIIDISKYADDKEHLLKLSVKPFGVCDLELIEYTRVALTE